jgi:DNA replication initiation complex subunit (GINS family)
VRFRLGRVSTKAKTGVHSQKSKVKTLTAEELYYIEKTTSQINDEKLKETVKRAMEKALTTKQGKR